MWKDTTRGNWISGKQLLKLTRITKKDFVRYLKLGILPKPVIRFNGQRPKGSRKNGYFPKSVLERIKMVEQLRKQGHPMEQIARKFNPGAANEDQAGSSTPDSHDKDLKQAGPLEETDTGAAANQAAKTSAESFVRKIQASSYPLPVSLAALAVQVDDWCRWQTSLLARDYHMLLDRLLTTASDVFSKHEGIFSFQPPAGMVCYFVEPLAEDYLARAINCAMDLNLAGDQASGIWQEQHGHLGKIKLNVGLHAGMEHLSFLPVSGGNQIIALGQVSEVAAQLAAISRAGQTWASKDVFNRLEPQYLDGVKFGIPKLQERWEVFLQGCFSKIQELVSLNILKSPFLEGINQLAVTQVIEHDAGKSEN